MGINTMASWVCRLWSKYSPSIIKVGVVNRKPTAQPIPAMQNPPTGLRSIAAANACVRNDTQRIASIKHLRAHKKQVGKCADSDVVRGILLRVCLSVC